MGGGGVEIPAHTHRHPWKCPRCQEDVAGCYRQCAWNACTHRLLWSVVSFLLVRVICKAAQSLLSSQYSAIFCSSAFFSLLGSFRHSSGRSLRLCLLVPDTDRGRIMGPAIWETSTSSAACFVLYTLIVLQGGIRICFDAGSCFWKTSPLPADLQLISTRMLGFILPTSYVRVGLLFPTMLGIQKCGMRCRCREDSLNMFELPLFLQDFNCVQIMVWKTCLCQFVQRLELAASLAEDTAQKKARSHSTPSFMCRHRTQG